jgi:hypothetical protein
MKGERSFAVDNHRPELDQRELRPETTHPSLNEQDGTPRVDDDRDRDDEDERKRHRDQEKAGEDVERSFGRTLDHAGAGG